MATIKKKGYSGKDHQEQAIVSLMHKVSSALLTYKKQITIIVMVLVIGSALAAGYALILARQDREAAPLVAAAYEHYNASGTAGADPQKALDAFRAVQKKYPGTKSGAIAQYYVGNCLVSLGRADEAIKEYLRFIDQYASDKLLLSLVYQRLGYVYSMTGRQNEAIKAFEQSEKSGGTGVATLELARVYDAAGNVLESQKEYKKVLEHYAGTSWGNEAMNKVNSLGPAPLPAQTAPRK